MGNTLKKAACSPDSSRYRQDILLQELLKGLSLYFYQVGISRIGGTFPKFSLFLRTLVIRLLIYFISTVAPCSSSFALSIQLPPLRYRFDRFWSSVNKVFCLFKSERSQFSDNFYYLYLLVSGC